MSREDIIAIAVRLFAIFLAILELRTIAQVVALLSTNTFVPGGLVVLVIVLLGMLAISALLWFFPLTVARKLLPVMKEPRSEIAMGAATAFPLALAVMGIWLFANAIVDVAYWLVLFAQVRGADMPGVELTPSQWSSVAATVVRLLLSLWLIFGNAGIRRLIARARHGGAAPDAA